MVYFDYAQEVGGEMSNKNVYFFIDKCDIVSFDVFDTLVVRNVSNPEAVFVELEKKLKNQNLIEESIDFFSARVQAQKTAYNVSRYEEVTLDEIYDSFSIEVREEKNKLISEEMELELLVCQQNYEIKKIYDYCVKKKKKIFITTDMYLPREFFERLLKKCGYVFYDEIYISSELRKRKSTGNLFEYILKNNSIEPSKMLHIGDNIKSDIIRAWQKNIKTWHVTNHIENKKENQFINWNNLQNKEQNENFSLGYNYLGPALLGFVKWLNERLEGYEYVFFLAREGAFIKECYEKVYGEDERFRYLCLSRKVVLLPSLVNVNSYDELMKVLEFRVNATIKILFEKCSLEKENYSELMNRYGFNENQILDDSCKIREFINMLIPDIKNKAIKQYELLHEYLQQQDFFEKNVAIVDIGWKGTMQYLLQNLFEDNEVKGFYFGLLSKHYLMEMEGYIVNNDDQLIAGMTLYETLFMPFHETVISYELTNEGIKPIFAPPEFEESEYLQISIIQDGAILYCKKHEIKGNDNPLLLFDIACNPKMRHVRLLGNLPFFDSYKSSLVCFDKKNVKANLIKSGWKIGYLKNLFKIKLPYVDLYFLLRKFAKVN